MTVDALPFDAERISLSGKNLIEASAGTGKTHAIATLFRRLVVESEMEPSEILVVTFTEAATSELRDRVRGELVRARGAPGETDARSERLRRALEGIDEAPISTIHGFCQRVLRDHALRSGVGYDAELVPDLEELYDDVIHDFWNARVAHGPASFAEALKDEGIGPARLRAILAAHRKNARITLVPEASDADPVLCFQHQFVEHAQKELLARKERRGVLGFEDLLERLRDAIVRPSGGVLVRALRDRFRAVLIDEFQDTDPTQSDIFERAFGNGDHPLFLIGDPKQAIYGFRGADVTSYLAAARGARRYTMGQNWRSDPAVVASVNRVFHRPGSFVVSGIDYHLVEAQPDAKDTLEVSHARGSEPLDVLLVERAPGDDKPISKPKSRLIVARIVAADIAELLRNDARADGRRISETDIAVLTRTNVQCFMVQEALRERGVHSVVIGDKSVFESDEAKDLEFVLGAVLEPGRSADVKRALASGLMGQKGEALIALDEDAGAYQSWLARFRAWNALWVERGFMSMFRALLAEAESAERLLSRPGGERRLTNVFHLAELLHRASTEEHLGPAALVGWLGEQTLDASARTEHTEIRLESDERAVRLLTVHKAKGLEFPIVYCPFLWDGGGKIEVPFPFHANGTGLCLELGADEKREKANRERAVLEGFAEELRVVYVALTRAKHRTTIVWGAFNWVGSCAGSYLFLPPPAKERGGVPKRSRLDKATDAELAACFQALTGSDASLRKVRWDFDVAPLVRPMGDAKKLAARVVERPVSRWQRVDSFTALVRNAGHGVHGAEPAAEADETARDREDGVETEPPVAVSTDAPALRERIVLDGFPRGRVTGDFFHSILEEIDFETVTAHDLIEVAQQKLEAFGLARGAPPEVTDAFIGQVVSALRDVLETPLAAAGGLRLRDVPKKGRFSELEFHVPAQGLDQQRLASVFRDHPTPELEPAYAERVGRLGFAPLSGFLKGYIDLVFVHAGRWYVADYKTNHLSDFVDEYERERITAAMAESHYYLQYHLYSLAVARFLRRYQAGFDYERDFGGVLYLFVKGMRPGRSTGIFFEKPPVARIRALSAAFGGPAW